MSFSYNKLSLNIQLRVGCGCDGPWRDPGPSREVTIPDFFNFGHLHKLMVLLFGWTNQHLHRFEVPKVDPWANPDPNDDCYMALLMIARTRKYHTWVSDPNSFLHIHEDNKERDEAEVPLSFAFSVAGDWVEYEYDFCKAWRAKIYCTAIERKTVKKACFAPSIQVIAGKGDTMPEYRDRGRDAVATAYNRKALNEAIADSSDMFMFLPYDADGESDELVEEKVEKDASPAVCSALSDSSSYIFCHYL